MQIDWSHFIAAGLAVGGGVAKSVNLWLRGKAENIIISRVAGQGFVSGYTGYACFQMGTTVLGFGPQSGPFFAIIGGWLGAEAMDLAVTWFKRTLKTEKEKNDD